MEKVVGASLSRQSTGWENLKPLPLVNTVFTGILCFHRTPSSPLEKESMGIERFSGHRLGATQGRSIFKSSARDSFGPLMLTCKLWATHAYRAFAAVMTSSSTSQVCFA